jgi:hypothetical protein
MSELTGTATERREATVEDCSAGSRGAVLGVSRGGGDWT